MPQTQSALRSRFPLLLFLAFYLFFSLWTFQDYGATWDETGVYTRGILLSHHFHHPEWNRLSIKKEADDGLVVYDHLYSYLLSFFNPNADIDLYHFLNLCFASLLFIAAFELLHAKFGSPYWALVGPLFLFFTPRLLGDIPANPKDVPFAVGMLVSLWATQALHDTKRVHPLLKVLFLGLLFGFTQSLRLLGFELYGLYFLFQLYKYWESHPKTSRKDWRPWLKETLLDLAIILCVSNILLIATWPYLEVDYFGHLRELLGQARHFPWYNDVLFLGKLVKSTELPIFYLPVWFLITTPLFILFLFPLGLKNLFNRKDKKKDLEFMGLLVLTLNALLVVGLRPVLYDGLRHFIFLLPWLGLLAASGVINLYRKKLFARWKMAGAALIVVNLALVGTHLFRLHPYEYVYFNETVGGLKGTSGEFETDYWGASNREAVNWLNAETRNQPRNFKVNGRGTPFQFTLFLSPKLAWSELKDADYYISTDGALPIPETNGKPAVHGVEREGVPLNYVFKLK
ncbi:MAG TPA: hypothetical protein VIJ93_09210 [bacterium]